MHYPKVSILLGTVCLLALPANLIILAGQGDLLTGAYTAHNRDVEVVQEGGERFIRLSETPGDGAAWLEDVEFTTGTIELDIRGKNKPGQSFVGVTFHSADHETYEAVYFRPFNFRSPDPDRQSHSVQYICHPEYTWHSLRSSRPGEFENSISPPPEAEAWLHARIVVEDSSIRVYVNGSSEPSLAVDRLTDRNTGRIGVWAGHNSAGDFKSFEIHAGP
ncbi:MAG: hypothetical protein JSU96_07230 [Acidobacteriota bacterium]|nr:MAG: hypothetical protein JSU96_07230 [Acidobacteriota bacterium]